MGEETIDWPGKSGKVYRYWIFKIDHAFSPQPANYIFAKETRPSTFSPIYIGQTSDLSERFDNHHKMPCIRRNGATHICAHKSSSNETERLSEELDLVKRWQADCNG